MLLLHLGPFLSRRQWVGPLRDHWPCHREPLDVLVNGTLIAHGEVVVVNDKFGIRMTDVISPSERIKKLG